MLHDAIEDVPGTIVIETFCDGETVQIAIGDSGRGIPPELLEKIFMPFSTSKEVGKGAGLGLFVSYGIVQSLGGAHRGAEHGRTGKHLHPRAAAEASDRLGHLKKGGVR